MKLCEKRPNSALIKGQDKDFCPLQWNLVCSFQENREQHPLGRSTSWCHAVILCPWPWKALSSFKGAPKWGWTEKSPVPGAAQVNSLWVWESVCDTCASPWFCSVLITAPLPAPGHDSPAWAHTGELGLPWAAADSECLLRSRERACAT